jgi:hypothetical protein
MAYTSETCLERNYILQCSIVQMQNVGRFVFGKGLLLIFCVCAVLLSNLRTSSSLPRNDDKILLHPFESHALPPENLQPSNVRKISSLEAYHNLQAHY